VERVLHRRAEYTRGHGTRGGGVVDSERLNYFLAFWETALGREVQNNERHTNINLLDNPQRGRRPGEDKGGGLNHLIPKRQKNNFKKEKLGEKVYL